MSELTDIERARIDRAKDNTKVNVRDLLRLALDDLDNGELKCDGCILVFINRPEVGDWDQDIYRSNIDRCAEVSMLTVAQHRAIKRWEND